MKALLRSGYAASTPSLFAVLLLCSSCSINNLLPLSAAKLLGMHYRQPGTLARLQTRLGVSRLLSCSCSTSCGADMYLLARGWQAGLNFCAGLSG